MKRLALAFSLLGLLACSDQGETTGQATPGGQGGASGKSGTSGHSGASGGSGGAGAGQGGSSGSSGQSGAAGQAEAGQAGAGQGGVAAQGGAGSSGSSGHGGASLAGQGGAGSSGSSGHGGVAGSEGGAAGTGGMTGGSGQAGQGGMAGAAGQGGMAGGSGQGGMAGAGGGQGGGAGQGGGGLEIRTARITTEHRFDPGKMFGGWGPHLGHLLRDGQGRLWFADDACGQQQAPVCDVLKNHRVDYLRHDAATDEWSKVSEQALPTGVQQNTGSLLHNGQIFSYGVDVAQGKLVECRHSIESGPQGCTALALEVGTSANYVGAALSPQGYHLTWLTNVVDNGSGSFRFFVDYGGGWNGPRLGDAGGQNDASYIHVAFGAPGSGFTMLGQLVSGVAPDWTFSAAVGTADLTLDAPVSWGMPLSAPPGDPLVSTTDLWADPLSGDLHLLARTQAGHAAYYHQPKAGVWSGPLHILQGAYRARWVRTAQGALDLFFGRAGQGLWVLPQTLQAGAPLTFDEQQSVPVSLPAGYSQIFAIYPESSIYQDTPTTEASVAVVGDEQQNEVWLVRVKN